MKLSIRSAALILLAAFCAAAGTAANLPNVFAPVLAEVKGKSQVPVLLPSNLPPIIAKAKNAVLDKASATEYAISLWYEQGVGAAGFAALFSARSAPGYAPDELTNVQPLRLARRLRGFFRPVSCGGSCTPANLSWREQGVLYEIQLKLPSTMPEQRQRTLTIATANSAILAGPR